MERERKRETDRQTECSSYRQRKWTWKIEFKSCLNFVICQYT